MKLRENFHKKVFYYLVIILAVALPLSVYVTSVIQFLLAFNWLLERNFKEKFHRIRYNKAFLVYLVFFAIHLIGLLWTSDLMYGLKDLKIKLPLIIIPFIIVSSGNFNRSQIRVIITFFVAGTMAATFSSMLALLGLLSFEINYVREASLFISHIRFSLMIVLSILFSFYLLLERDRQVPSLLKWFYPFSIIWLSIFLILSQTLTGIVIIIIVSVFVAVKLVKYVRDQAIRFMAITVIVFVPLFALVYFGNAINRFYSVENIDLNDLDSLTINNNPYVHKTEINEFENGNFVWIYICPEELEREWNKLSDIDYLGITEEGDQLKYTLIRYLTSKGLRKDSVGVHQLNDVVIEAIEKGIANHIYLDKFALYPRIYEVIWEFDRYRLGYNPNDKSIIQRYYFLKAGMHILSENIWTGVGTGDVRSSFKAYYEDINSPLHEKRRRNAHNQFLTFAISFGLPLFILVMAALIVPVFIKKRRNSYMCVVFLLTMALSMLNEDTLGNTPGVVIFGLFYSLFVFGPGWNWDRLCRGAMAA